MLLPSDKFDRQSSFNKDLLNKLDLLNNNMNKNDDKIDENAPEPT